MLYFSTHAQKIKKNPPRKKFCIFQEMELLAVRLKKFLYFLIFQETEAPKKILYISGNRNPKEASYISGNGTLHFSVQALKINRIPSQTVLILWQKWNFPTHILKSSYFRKRKPRKNSLYWNLFFYFRKWKPRKNYLYFQETELLYFRKGIFRTLT